MKYKELEYHASSCQMAADEMASKFVTIQNALRLQAICDFNLLWLYDISPELVLRSSTIDFLSSNAKKFTRKITVKEMLYFDSLLSRNEVKDFDEFKKLF